MFHYFYFIYRYVLLLSVVLRPPNCKSTDPPIATTHAIFIKHLPIVQNKAKALLIKHTNTNPLLKHLGDLREIHDQIGSMVYNLNISVIEFPTYGPLSKETLNLLENIALTLVNTLTTLPQSKECAINNSRIKRALLYQPTGLFPGLGRALAMLTGTLSADAADMINSNNDNLQILEKSQHKLISVVNDTLTLATQNKKRLSAFKEKLSYITVMTSKTIDKFQSINLIIAMYQNFILAAQQLQNHVNLVTKQWDSASVGIISTNLLSEPFYKFILELLDEDTIAHNNLKYIIKHAAQITVECCHTNVWLSLHVPLLSKQTVSAYRVHPTPYWHLSHYESLENVPYMIGLSNTMTYEYTIQEANACIKLKSIQICDPPRTVKPAGSSCMYSLIKKLSHKCKVSLATNVTGFDIFEDSYLTYFHPYNTTKLINIAFPHGHSNTKEIKGAGTVKLPFRCNLLIDNIVYSNSLPSGTNTFNETPTFYKTQFNYTIKHTNFKTDVQDIPGGDPELIAHKLAVTSEILGNFDVSPNHILLVSYTGLTISSLILLAIAVTACIYCRPGICCPIRRGATHRAHRPSI